ncbi:MAG TPA: hypothetical protein VMH28_22905 [Candidatus Acidoferrales bacterium]|nr:hypothetical protein [Candidatus Acidoferrales bacterium]
MNHFLIILALLFAAAPERLFGAIGCTLSNPAEDLKYLYPEMTTFKEELKEFPKLPDGAGLFKGLRARLGSDLDPIYETYETPYTVYSIFKGDARIGVVHGVNVPGKGGVIQVFVATDPKTGEIKNFFFQRLESPAARQLRSKEFRMQFEGLTLADFYKHDYYAAAQPGAKADKLAALKPPSLDPGGKPDYEASLRGLRKNLILLDYFVYGRRFEPFFERAQQARKN